MKLVSIISAWSDSIELLPFCIDNHLKFCDGVIVCWSSSSNHFVRSDAMLQFVATHNYQNVLFHQIEPVHKLKPLANETRKRNAGIDTARANGYSHFFLSDADEFYVPSEVQRVKSMFDDHSLKGVVCKLRVYIKTPQLWCNDKTLVSFIHKLGKDTYTGNFPQYPFAYDESGTARIDPSRRINETHGIQMCEAITHHFSYLRSNISMKIENSTANLKRIESVIRKDQAGAAPGYVSQMYGEALQESENLFGITI